MRAVTLAIFAKDWARILSGLWRSLEASQMQATVAFDNSLKTRA